ncbi:MerR family DNA-binding transcriptional regulator [Actinomadura madurae]|uniref:MerR family DNA-binding transcriptional regulator n=1 Tax=Actinomadura madurae TaxID=1993 RepID=UPI0020D24564|nr:MerR family DNA-binding transcriptional regulator [Actinomadura madurae]MCP9982415.1 MerR family DNA-binding transcriptional regulator [Actinomadura madurae]
MRIGELSHRTGVKAHQLRYYEAQGLLDAGRGGQRLPRVRRGRGNAGEADPASARCRLVL